MSKAADLANLIGNINAGGGGVNRNVIINGAMNVAQRGTSSTGISSGGYYTVDRFKVSTNSAGRSTMTQETITDLPGFANAIKLDCTTADTSLGSGEYLQLSQYIEGQNLQTFAKGTSDAKPMTVSFYVKGNGNATYMCELYDGDNGRRSGIQFSVTSSWNRVSLTFDGDTTGAFDDDNALSLYVNLWLAAGSGYSGGTYTANTWAGNVNANRAVGADNFYSSTDNEFFITGFQMEVGQNATTFEHEPFESTLEKCLRYYEIIKPLGISNGVFGFGGYYSSTLVFLDLVYKQKRSTSPAFEQTTITNGYLIETNSTSDYWNSFTGMLRQTDTRSQIYTQSDVSGTAGMAGMCWTNSTNTFLAVEDEL